MFRGENAWCRLFPEIRDELYFVMDDGWEVPFCTDTPVGKLECEYYKALEPHPSKFPFLHGTPAEKLSRLNERVKAEGWHGLGLWIAANAYKNGRPAEYHAPDREIEEWWRERILNSCQFQSRSGACCGCPLAQSSTAVCRRGSACLGKIADGKAVS